MKVKFNNLNLQYLQIKENLHKRWDTILANSSFINGKEVEEFENLFANYIGTKYAIGVSNGTDALKLATKALDLKGKVGIFIPANTFISTAIGPLEIHPNADLFLVDCDEYFLMDSDKLEKLLKSFQFNYDYRIIIPVHLYGQMCDMNKIKDLAYNYDCFIIEDASQAHGSLGDNKKAGSFSHMGCFSLYPGKNLGAFGDAGIITTNDEFFVSKLKTLRNLGSKIKYNHEISGFNHRLDTIQASVLIEKLKYLDGWNNFRINVASQYNTLINNDLIIKPSLNSFTQKHVYHIYCIIAKNNKRDELIKYLNDCNIETVIHYPILIEEMPMFSSFGYYNENARNMAKSIISLPMHPFLTQDEINYVCEKINRFC